jgi:hypothetical protein
MGRSLSSQGTGIEGVAESTTGTTKGVSGNVFSANGYSGYFTGGKFYVSGRVGIGTLTPAYLLHAVTSAESAMKGETSTSSGTGVAGYATSTTGTTYGVVGQSSSPSGYGVYGSNSASSGSGYGVAGFTSSPDGYSGYFFGGKFYLYGKMGIGTTDPWAGLHVKGSEFPGSFVFVEASAGKDAGIRFYEGGTVKWHIFNNALSGGLQIYNSGGTPAIFVKQSNSYVGIATTTPAYNLEVIGTAGKTGGGSWSTSSDKRLKDVHGNYTKGLKEINALQPVLFDYKEGNARKLPANAGQIGFIAQDVQKVFPEAVSEGQDGYLDFNIHAVNVAMVNAIKELKAENERLKTENEQLKALNYSQSADIEQVKSRLEKIETLISIRTGK